MTKTSLFIGRFQPFHKGHLTVVSQALKECDFLIIGLGSAENYNEPDNPFTAGERFVMIQAALDELKIDRALYAIIPVRNINNYDLWVEHVSRLLPPFESVYTGSEIVTDLFKKHGKYRINSVDFMEKVSGTEVRRQLKLNQNWENLVPPAVAKYLKKNNGSARLQKIL